MRDVTPNSEFAVAEFVEDLSGCSGAVVINLGRLMVGEIPKRCHSRFGRHRERLIGHNERVPAEHGCEPGRTSGEHRAVLGLHRQREEVAFDEEIDDEIFTYEPPEDAEIREFDDLMPQQYADVDAADVPFDVPQPDVPAKYTLESVLAGENMVGWSATLQYTDDTGSFLTVGVADEAQDPVFEPDSDPVEIDDVDATIREVTETRTIVEWEDDGLTYTVGGELTADELIEIAESIVH